MARSYTRRSTIIFLISAIALAGLRSFGQACAQFIARVARRRAKRWRGHAKSKDNDYGARLNPTLNHHLLDFSDRFSRVKVLRAGLRAIHNRMTAI